MLSLVIDLIRPCLCWTKGSGDNWCYQKTRPLSFGIGRCNNLSYNSHKKSQQWKNCSRSLGWCQKWGLGQSYKAIRGWKWGHNSHFRRLRRRKRNLGRIVCKPVEILDPEPVLVILRVWDTLKRGHYVQMSMTNRANLGQKSRQSLIIVRKWNNFLIF